MKTVFTLCENFITYGRRFGYTRVQTFDYPFQSSKRYLSNLQGQSSTRNAHPKHTATLQEPYS